LTDCEKKDIRCGKKILSILLLLGMNTLISTGSILLMFLKRESEKGYGLFTTHDAVYISLISSTFFVPKLPEGHLLLP
jgi:hypothetical protein